MTAARLERDVAAPLATTAGAVRSVVVAAALAGHARVQVPRAQGLLAPGDVVAVRPRRLPVTLGLRVAVAELHQLRLSRQRGPLPSLEVTVTLAPTTAGTRLVAQVRGPSGGLVRGWVQAVLGEWVDHVSAAATAMVAAREVVAGAVVADGRLLVAQRRRPPALAGKWELAGGGVEPGESPQQALVRELDEELGVVVEPGEQVGADVLLPDGRVLRAYRAELVRGPAEAREHAALRWVGAGELSRLDLVVNDRGWRAELAPLLVE